MSRYFVIYKPYHVLSQFSAEGGKQTLQDFFSVPSDVYPVGRLDYDSEGLLILTNDTTLNHRLLNPVFEHSREYWVQVEGNISLTAIEQLRAGVAISINSQSYRTKRCEANIIDGQPNVAERNPRIRFRKNIPTSWVSLILTEGKNRQVRKMTAAVGYPTLRLIRVRVEQLTVYSFQPGEMRELSREDIYARLFPLQSSTNESV